MSNRAAVPEAPKAGRIAQILQSYKLTRQSDPAIGWILLALVVVIPLVVIGIALLLGTRSWALIPWVIIGILLGLIAATFIFGRRAERAAYAQIEGQPGAAAAALGSLRSGWFTTPAVNVTKNQDIVHRVVGRPGVILVSEGPPARAGQLLATAAIIGVSLYALGLTWQPALIVGLALAMSSTAIAMQSVQQRGIGPTDTGRATLVTLLSNLAADLAYGWLDPRIGLQ